MDSQKNTKNKENIVAWWQPALMMFARLSAWIVAPVILGTFLGKYLDDKFESAPVFTVGIVGFSFLVSMFGLIKETIKEYKRIEDENKK